MQLCETDAEYAAGKFIDYFSNKGRIDEYLRNVKLDRISQQTPVPDLVRGWYVLWLWYAPTRHEL